MATLSTVLSLRHAVLGYRTGTVALESLRGVLMLCVEMVRRPAQRRPRDAAAREGVRASAEPGSRLVGLVFRLSDELDMHEEDAREFVLAAADPALLPSEPYFFPAGLQHFLRAKRLALFQRHALLATLEELLLLRQVDADVLELTERLLLSPLDAEAPLSNGTSAVPASRSLDALPRGLIDGVSALTREAADCRTRDPFEYACGVADRQRAARCLLQLYASAPIQLDGTAGNGNAVILAAGAVRRAESHRSSAAENSSGAPRGQSSALSLLGPAHTDQLHADGGDLAALLSLLRAQSNELFKSLDHGDGNPLWELCYTLLGALMTALETSVNGCVLSGRTMSDSRTRVYVQLLHELVGASMSVSAAARRAPGAAASAATASTSSSHTAADAHGDRGHGHGCAPNVTDVEGRVLAAAGYAGYGAGPFSSAHAWDHTGIHGIVCIAMGLWYYGGLVAAAPLPQPQQVYDGGGIDDIAAAALSASTHGRRVAHKFISTALSQRGVHTLSRVLASPSFICSPIRGAVVSLVADALGDLLRFEGHCADAAGADAELEQRLLLRTRRSCRKLWIYTHTRGARRRGSHGSHIAFPQGIGHSSSSSGYSSSGAFPPGIGGGAYGGGIGGGGIGAGVGGEGWWQRQQRQHQQQQQASGAAASSPLGDDGVPLSSSSSVPSASAFPEEDCIESVLLLFAQLCRASPSIACRVWCAGGDAVSAAVSNMSSSGSSSSSTRGIASRAQLMAHALSGDGSTGDAFDMDGGEHGNYSGSGGRGGGAAALLLGACALYSRDAEDAMRDAAAASSSSAAAAAVPMPPSSSSSSSFALGGEGEAGRTARFAWQDHTHFLKQQQQQRGFGAASAPTFGLGMPPPSSQQFGFAAGLLASSGTGGGDAEMAHYRGAAAAAADASAAEEKALADALAGDFARFQVVFLEFLAALGAGPLCADGLTCGERLLNFLEGAAGSSLSISSSSSSSAAASVGALTGPVGGDRGDARLFHTPLRLARFGDAAHGGGGGGGVVSACPPPLSLPSLLSQLACAASSLDPREDALRIAAYEAEVAARAMRAEAAAAQAASLAALPLYGVYRDVGAAWADEAPRSPLYPPPPAAILVALLHVLRALAADAAGVCALLTARVPVPESADRAARAAAALASGDAAAASTLVAAAGGQGGYYMDAQQQQQQMGSPGLISGAALMRASLANAVSGYGAGAGGFNAAAAAAAAAGGAPYLPGGGSAAGAAAAAAAAATYGGATAVDTTSSSTCLLDILAHLLSLGGNPIGLGLPVKTAIFSLMAHMTAHGTGGGALGPALPLTIAGGWRVADILDGAIGPRAANSNALAAPSSFRAGAAAGWGQQQQVQAQAFGGGFGSASDGVPFTVSAGVGLRYELEALEVPERNYEASIALCALLRVLLRLPARQQQLTSASSAAAAGAAASGSSRLSPGLLMLVVEYVLLRAGRRAVAEEADTHRLLSAALGVLLDAVTLDSSCSSATSAAGEPAGLAVMRLLMTHSDALAVVTDILLTGGPGGTLGASSSSHASAAGGSASAAMFGLDAAASASYGEIWGLSSSSPAYDRAQTAAAATAGGGVQDALLALEAARDSVNDRSGGAAIALRSLTHARALTHLAATEGDGQQQQGGGVGVAASAPRGGQQQQPSRAVLFAAAGAPLPLTPVQRAEIERETIERAERCVWAAATGGGALGSVTSPTFAREASLTLAISLLGAAVEAEGGALIALRTRSGSGGGVSSFVPTSELLRRARVMPTVARLVGYRHSDRIGLAAARLLTGVLTRAASTRSSSGGTGGSLTIGGGGLGGGGSGADALVRDLRTSPASFDIAARLSSALDDCGGSDAGDAEVACSCARLADHLRSTHAEGEAEAAAAGVAGMQYHADAVAAAAAGGPGGPGGGGMQQAGFGDGYYAHGGGGSGSYATASASPAPSPTAPDLGVTGDGGDLWDEPSSLRLPTGLTHATPAPMHVSGNIAPHGLLPFAPPPPAPDGGALGWATASATLGSCSSSSSSGGGGAGPAGEGGGGANSSAAARALIAIESAAIVAGRAAKQGAVLRLLARCLSVGLAPPPFEFLLVDSSGGDSAEDTAAAASAGELDGEGGGGISSSGGGLVDFALWVLGFTPTAGLTLAGGSSGSLVDASAPSASALSLEVRPPSCMHPIVALLSQPSSSSAAARGGEAPFASRRPLAASVAAALLLRLLRTDSSGGSSTQQRSGSAAAVSRATFELLDRWQRAVSAQQQQTQQQQRRDDTTLRRWAVARLFDLPLRDASASALLPYYASSSSAADADAESDAASAASSLSWLGASPTNGGAILALLGCTPHLLAPQRLPSAPIFASSDAAFHALLSCLLDAAALDTAAMARSSAPEREKLADSVRALLLPPSPPQQQHAPVEIDIDVASGSAEYGSSISDDSDSSTDAAVAPYMLRLLSSIPLSPTPPPPPPPALGFALAQLTQGLAEARAQGSGSSTSSSGRSGGRAATSPLGAVMTLAPGVALQTYSPAVVVELARLSDAVSDQQKYSSGSGGGGAPLAEAVALSWAYEVTAYGVRVSASRLLCVRWGHLLTTLVNAVVNDAAAAASVAATAAMAGDLAPATATAAATVDANGFAPLGGGPRPSSTSSSAPWGSYQQRQQQQVALWDRPVPLLPSPVRTLWAVLLDTLRALTATSTTSASAGSSAATGGGAPAAIVEPVSACVPVLVTAIADAAEAAAMAAAATAALGAAHGSDLRRGGSDSSSDGVGADSSSAAPVYSYTPSRVGAVTHAAASLAMRYAGVGCVGGVPPQLAGGDGGIALAAAGADFTSGNGGDAEGTVRRHAYEALTLLLQHVTGQQRALRYTSPGPAAAASASFVTALSSCGDAFVATLCADACDARTDVRCVALTLLAGLFSSSGGGTPAASAARASVGGVGGDAAGAGVDVAALESSAAAAWASAQSSWLRALHAGHGLSRLVAALGDADAAEADLRQARQELQCAAAAALTGGAADATTTITTGGSSAAFSYRFAGGLSATATALEAASGAVGGGAASAPSHRRLRLVDYAAAAAAAAATTTGSGGRGGLSSTARGGGGVAGHRVVPPLLISRLRAVSIALRGVQKCAVLTLEALLALAASRITLPTGGGADVSSDDAAAALAGTDRPHAPLLLLLCTPLLSVLTAGRQGGWERSACEELGALLQDGPSAPTHALRAVLLSATRAQAGAGVDEDDVALLNSVSLDAAAADVIDGAAAAAAAGAGTAPAAVSSSAASTAPLPYIAAVATALSPRLTPLLSCLVALLDAAPSDTGVAASVWEWATGPAAPLLDVVIAGACCVPTMPHPAAAAASSSSGGGAVAGATTSLSVLQCATAAVTLLGRTVTASGRATSSSSVSSSAAAAMDAAARVDVLVLRLFSRFTCAALPTQTQQQSSHSSSAAAAAAAPLPSPDGLLQHWARHVVPVTIAEALDADTHYGFYDYFYVEEARAAASAIAFWATAGNNTQQGVGGVQGSAAALARCTLFSASVRLAGHALGTAVAGYTRSRCAPFITLRAPLEFGSSAALSVGARGSSSSAMDDVAAVAARGGCALLFRAPDTGVVTAGGGQGGGGLLGYGRFKGGVGGAGFGFLPGSSGSGSGGGGISGGTGGISSGGDGPLSGVHSLPTISLLLGAVDAAAGLLAGWAQLAQGAASATMSIPSFAAVPPMGFSSPAAAVTAVRGGRKAHAFRSEEAAAAAAALGDRQEGSFLSSLLCGFENLVGAWLAHAVADEALRLHSEDVVSFSARPHVVVACAFSPFAAAALRQLQDLGVEQRYY